MSGTRKTLGTLLIVFVVGALGAGRSAAAQEPPGVTLSLSVELRGTLTFADKQATVRVHESKPGDLAARVEAVWTLDLTADKALLKEAKQLDGKQVIVTGTCRLLGVKTETRKYKRGACIN